MRKLTVAQRASVLALLCEGVSIRGTQRITGISVGSILAYLLRSAEAFEDYMDTHLVNLPCTHLQLDEIWSFVECKEKTKIRTGKQSGGDIWVWTAVCANTKVVPTWRVGDRSQHVGNEFCYDLAGRVRGEVQITSDGNPVYRTAMAQAFPEGNLGMLIKKYVQDEQGREFVQEVEKRKLQGDPKPGKISTSYVERHNLTIRMGNRRFTRLTNGHSKNAKNHCAMFAVQMMHYNFGRKHLSLNKQTPAMAAGIMDAPMPFETMVKLVEEFYERQLSNQFLNAFSSKYAGQRFVPKSHASVGSTKTPWYLDPESGGPHPFEKKPGVDYEE